MASYSPVLLCGQNEAGDERFHLDVTVRTLGEAEVCLPEMIDKGNFEVPRDIHPDQRAVALVDQFVRGDPPFTEEVGEEGFRPVEVTLEESSRRSRISSGRAVEVIA